MQNVQQPAAHTTAQQAACKGEEHEVSQQTQHAAEPWTGQGAREPDSHAMNIPMQESDNPTVQLHDTAGTTGYGGTGPNGTGSTDKGATGSDGTGKGTDKQGEKSTMQHRYSALKPFIIISLSYLLYTTTDGAIRMIVLLNAYNLGFTAWQVALMFTAYELAGVFTNLAAGMMGAKWGIKSTLLTGLSLQLVGISMLYAWQDSWSGPGQKWKAIVFVTFAQMLCGIAKDLTKLGGKTVTKLVTPEEKQSQLFKLVSLITGWKNSLKGAGYFLGAACISYKYEFALGMLLLLIVLAMPWAIIGLSNELGRARSKNLGLTQIFKQKYNVNVLSVSRFFLFGARDMWFEVPLPFFLRDTVVGLGWSRPITGLFLAIWIIVYGQCQSWTPQLVLKPLRQAPANALVGLFWCAVLVICPVFMGGMIQWSSIFLDRQLKGMIGVMVAGLYLFCIVFAVNSAVHSYLIVKYADGDKVALNIGFYYMANAVGRLTGTLVSGVLYSFSSSTLQGFAACFWASAGFAALSVVVDCFLRDGQQGLHLGPCLTLIPPQASTDSMQASGSDKSMSAEKLAIEVCGEAALAGKGSVAVSMQAAADIEAAGLHQQAVGTKADRG